MNMRVLYILILGILLPACPGSLFGQEQTVPELVKASFEGYRQAVLEDNGALASTYVSRITIAYYDSAISLARTADSLRVDSLPLIEKMTVLLIRGEMSTEMITGSKSGDGFIFAINEGMVSKDDVRKNELGKVFFDDAFARAPMVVNGQVTPMPMHFHLEEGIWKLDLTSLFPITEPVIQQMIEESEMEENEFMQFLVTITLRGADEENPIWHPVE